MKSRLSSDHEKYISQILTFSPHPRSPIMVFSKDGNNQLIPNNKIAEFIKGAECSGLIETDLANAVKSDYSHLFSPPPTQDQLVTLYQQMQTYIIQGLRNAEKAGKKLFIIVGEDHLNKDSLMLQTMLLYIIKTAQINTLLVEASPNLLDKLIYEPRLVKELNAEYSIPLAVQELKMNVVGADLDTGSCPSTSSREAFMITKCLEKNDNFCFITGAAHMKHLFSDQSLQKNYHIIGLNIACIKPEQLAYEMGKLKLTAEKESLAFATASKKIVQVNLPGNITTEEQIDIMASARNIHYLCSGQDKALMSSLGETNSSLKKEKPTVQVNKLFNRNEITNSNLGLFKNKSEKQIYTVGDVCLVIKKNQPGSLEPYSLYSVKSGKKVSSTKMYLDQGAFNNIIAAMKKGTEPLINVLKSYGWSTTQNANLLSEEFKKENQIIRATI